MELTNIRDEESWERSLSYSELAMVENYDDEEEEEEGRRYTTSTTEPTIWSRRSIS